MLCARVNPVGHETVALHMVAGRVLAEDLRADRLSPAMDVSAMDGYAVRLADLTSPRLRVTAEARIGHGPPPMPQGGCVRIATGAGVPLGADAVIKREEVQELPGSDPGTVAAITLAADAASRIRPGQHIRRAGENAPIGALIAERGSLITAPVAGALASFGVHQPVVHRALRVAVISTGDEVVPADEGSDEPLPPWRLRDGNGPSLRALLGSAAWVGSVAVRHVPDDEALLERAIRDALDSADAMLLTGGVSMGHRDFVPAALARQGVRTLFHRLPQRPGRPVLGGVTPDNRPVLALPGNPVSVLVTATRLAGPVLARLSGLRRTAPVPVVQVTNADDAHLSLWWHRLVRLVDAAGGARAELVDARGSGDFVAAASSDGFIELPPEAAGPGPWPFRAWRLF